MHQREVIRSVQPNRRNSFFRENAIDLDHCLTGKLRARYKRLKYEANECIRTLPYSTIDSRKRHGQNEEVRTPQSNGMRGDEAISIIARIKELEKE